MMQLKIALALVVALLLAGTHWKAYVAGEKKVLDAQVQAALAQSEAARLRERALSLTNEGVQREHLAEKKRLAAVAAAAGERVRLLGQALAAAAGADAPAEPGADDPRGVIAGECAQALVALDSYAGELAGSLAALQGYTGQVCLGRP